MTLSRPCRTLGLLAWVVVSGGCDRAGPSATPAEGATPTQTTSPDDAASVEPAGDPGPGTPSTAGSEKPEIAGAKPSLNAPYEDQADPGRWTGRFEREGREVFDHRNEIVDALQLRPGLEVADVGAGTGLFTMELSRAVGPQGTVYAVDVQDYFLEHIRDRAKKAGRDNVRTVQATQRSTELAPDSIDLALLVDAYHHIEHPRPYLRSLAAALREDGRLVVIDYRRIEGRSEPWLLEHIRADPETFRREIESAGFELKQRRDLLEENFFFEFVRSKPH